VLLAVFLAVIATAQGQPEPTTMGDWLLFLCHGWPWLFS
jgi:hypothetical protein